MAIARWKQWLIFYRVVCELGGIFDYQSQIPRGKGIYTLNYVQTKEKVGYCMRNPRKIKLLKLIWHKGCSNFETLTSREKFAHCDSIISFTIARTTTDH